MTTLLFAAVLTLQAGPAETVATHSHLREASRAALPIQTGVASYYADKYHGRPTASGEIFDTYKFTAAHNAYAFGTCIRVTNLENQRTVIVRINDRGPFVSGRIIDLSRASARELRMEKAGLAKVKIEVVPVSTGQPVAE